MVLPAPVAPSHYTIPSIASKLPPSTPGTPPASIASVIPRAARLAGRGVAMHRYVAPTVAALLLFAAAAFGTIYTNPTTGVQSPGYVPESAPGVPYSASNPIPSGSVPTGGTGSYSAATIGAASGQAVAAGTAVVFLDLVNQSATATIACAFGAPAVLNGAGSITIPPLWHRSWEGSFVPTDAVNCIASAAATPATIGVK